MFHIALLLIASLLSYETRAATPQELQANLNSQQRSWVNDSCKRSLGASLWSSCVRREAGTILQGIPNFSELPGAAKSWIANSCARTLGPSLYSSCVVCEKRAVADLPSVSGLSPGDKQWVNFSCRKTLGPSLWSSCTRREVSALKSM